MRRQTRRDSTGKAFFKPADPDCGSCRNCDRLAGCMGRWAEALAAYEDTGLTADELPRAAELVRADKEGRCVVLDEKTTLAMAAGARAIENNKRLEGTTYCWNVFGEYGEPKEISYFEAAKRLREISEPVLTRAEAEAALGGGEHV